jgi:hypothetical protein
MEDIGTQFPEPETATQMTPASTNSVDPHTNLISSKGTDTGDKDDGLFKLYTDTENISFHDDVSKSSATEYMNSFASNLQDYPESSQYIVSYEDPVAKDVSSASAFPSTNGEKLVDGKYRKMTITVDSSRLKSVKKPTQPQLVRSTSVPGKNSAVYLNKVVLVLVYR